MNQKNIWYVIGFSWLIFIVIDLFTTGVLYVLLNNVYTYLAFGETNAFQSRLLPVKRALASILFSVYKLSFVPFYWLILYVLIRKSGMIFQASLLRTILTFTFCFLIAFALFSIISLILDPTSLGSLIALWTNFGYNKFIVLSSFFSAILSSVLWFMVMKLGPWNRNKVGR